MACLNLLPVILLADFSNWLIKNYKWQVVSVEDKSELLRAESSTRTRPLIVYKNENSKYVSVLNRDIRIVCKFLREREDCYAEGTRSIHD